MEVDREDVDECGRIGSVARSRGVKVKDVKFTGRYSKEGWIAQAGGPPGRGWGSEWPPGVLSTQIKRSDIHTARLKQMQRDGRGSADLQYPNLYFAANNHCFNRRERSNSSTVAQESQAVSKQPN